MGSYKCIICKSTDNKILFNPRDYRLNNSKETFQYVECQNCGLIIQWPPLGVSDLENHYNQNNIYEPIREKKGLKKIIDEYGLKKRANVILKNKPNGYLLDIGCGSGSFIQHISNNANFKVVGTEINLNNLETLREYYKLDVRQGYLSEINFPDNHFDVITMWDVLEHVQNPNQIIKEVKRILKSDGILIVRVPNGDSVDYKLFGRYWAGLDAPRHLFVFNKNTMKKLLANNNFISQSIQTDIGGYLNFINSISFWLNDTKIDSKLNQFILRILRSLILQIILFPLNWIRNHFFEGTSMTIVARPQKIFLFSND